MQIFAQNLFHKQKGTFLYEAHRVRNTMQGAAFSFSNIWVHSGSFRFMQVHLGPFRFIQVTVTCSPWFTQLH